jgi:DNA-binding Lrp family transcriptional regulator
MALFIIPQELTPSLERTGIPTRLMGRFYLSNGALLNLDDLDMRIIRELGGSPLWNVRESYSNISRKLGVDEETVRARVNRVKQRGFIPVWRMMINPLLIDFREAHLDLEVREEEHKADAISKVRTVDGVHYIDDFRGKEILVGMCYENDESLAIKVQRIESICGSSRVALWTSRFPRPDVRMSHLDWRIIDAMREDAWRDLEEIGKSLGVSGRTVQRRLTAMKEGKAVYLSRPPNVSVVGGLMCNFVVFCPDRQKKRAVDQVIQSTFDRIGAFHTSPEEYSSFGISCENFSEADKVTERLKAIDGVQSVRMRVVKEIVVVDDWLKEQIAMRL